MRGAGSARRAPRGTTAERLLPVALLPEALEALGVGDEPVDLLQEVLRTDSGTTTGFPVRGRSTAGSCARRRARPGRQDSSETARSKARTAAHELRSKRRAFSRVSSRTSCPVCSATTSPLTTS